MKEEKRGNGRGKVVLNKVEKYLESLGSSCFCVPKSQLEKFYSSIGFKRISPTNSPNFLQDRMEGYIEEGYDVILMRRN